MTADTNSPLLGLLLQGTGNNNAAWGQNLNDQVISLLENAIAGLVHINSTGGTYTLNAAEARSAILVIDNTTLASDLTVVVPDTTKTWTVINNGTKAAGFFVIFKTSINSVNVPFQKTSLLNVQSGAFIGRLDSCEIGRYVYDAVTGGDDVLECDGSYFKKLSLPSLFAKIGTTFGTTDSSNFRVPLANDTGRFLRSRSSGVVAGTSQSNQNKSHTHTGSGTTSGQSATHTHTGSGTTSGVSAVHTHTGSGTTSVESADHSHTFSGTTATESATHTHTISGLGTVAVTNGTGASQGNLLTTSGGSAATIGPSGVESANHTHTYSGTTSGISATHTHTYSFTTSAASVDHTHTYSFTTSAASVDHNHAYSFTTSTGSADGAEARPESLVGVLCIRY